MYNEASLISKLKNRDERALSLFYDRYAGAIYSVILRMIKDEGKAQDLLQETFMTVWDKAESFDANKGRFYTWVYRIAKNKVLNILRKKTSFIQTDDLSVYSNTEDITSLKQECLGLKGAISKLETHHQNALDLVYFKGYTHQEAHEEMGIPLGTFKSYVRQALRQLRETYAKALSFIILMLNVL